MATRYEPDVTAADLAVAALAPRCAEPGEYVRCGVCESPRFVVLAPRALRCACCGSLAAFLDEEPGETRRASCCGRDHFNVVAATRERAAALRCLGCLRTRAAPFPVGAAGVYEARRVPRSSLWGDLWRSASRKRTTAKSRDPRSGVTRVADKS